MRCVLWLCLAPLPGVEGKADDQEGTAAKHRPLALALDLVGKEVILAEGLPSHDGTPLPGIAQAHGQDIGADHPEYDRHFKTQPVFASWSRCCHVGLIP